MRNILHGLGPLLLMQKEAIKRCSQTPVLFNPKDDGNYGCNLTNSI